MLAWPAYACFMTQSLWAFIGISLLVIATPGPDTALTVRNTLLGGRRGGGVTAAGVAAGQMVWALATSAGLVALLVASEWVFEAVRWLGAAYLVWLGVHAIWSAWRGQAASAAGRVGTSSRLSGRSAFRQGLLSDLGNPKMAVFFSSLLPQFSDASFGSLASLGLVFAAMTFAWLLAYAIAISLAGGFMRRRAIWRTVETITGTALIALGLRLASEQR
jgi:threonine/homoserine/homoserine lactone efflux protein